VMLISGAAPAATLNHLRASSAPVRRPGGTFSRVCGPAAGPPGEATGCRHD
jgi:hypothetical protein